MKYKGLLNTINLVLIIILSLITINQGYEDDGPLDPCEAFVRERTFSLIGWAKDGFANGFIKSEQPIQLSLTISRSPTITTPVISSLIYGPNRNVTDDVAVDVGSNSLTFYSNRQRSSSSASSSKYGVSSSFWSCLAPSFSLATATELTFSRRIASSSSSTLVFIASLASCSLARLPLASAQDCPTIKVQATLKLPSLTFELLLRSVSDNSFLVEAEPVTILTEPPPTQPPTQPPTDAPTEAPTNSPTGTPTDVPTEVPTDSPTGTPTDVPTDAPTDVPTKAPITVTGPKCSSIHPLTNKEGVCINTTQCDNYGGVQADLCPNFGSDIKCCSASFITAKFPTIVGPICSAPHPNAIDGRGACIEQSNCQQNGGITVTKLCPAYGNSILCCAGNGLTVKYQITGHKCSGPNPNDSKGRGACIDLTLCSNSGGISVTGLCPKDPTNVRCCGGDSLVIVNT